MQVNELVSALNLTVVAGEGGLEHEVTGGYAADLLSCVMAGAEAGDVWVTLQAHPNVVAVAGLRELACVIVTEGAQPDSETLDRANETDIPLLLTDESTYRIVGRLTALGVE